MWAIDLITWWAFHTWPDQYTDLIPLKLDYFPQSSQLHNSVLPFSTSYGWYFITPLIAAFIILTYNNNIRSMYLVKPRHSASVNQTIFFLNFHFTIKYWVNVFGEFCRFCIDSIANTDYVWKVSLTLLALLTIK